MTAPAPRLDKLLALAKETSSDKRRELLREITDVFLDDPGVYGAEEIGHFDAIMCHVSANVEAAMRKDLAERMAEVPEAPRGLIRQFAADEIEIAQPVLEKSPVLTDEDLLEIIEAKGSPHMKAISARPEVSERVTDRIVERGDDDVLETLVNNAGARISRKSMSHLVTRSEGSEQLQAPLVDRDDLPPDLMNSMFFFVSAKLKKEIMRRDAGLDPEMIEEKIQESWSAIKGDAIVQGEMSEAERYVADLARSRRLNEPMLLELIDTRRKLEFLHAFAHLIETDMTTAQRILNDRSCESLAIACKAARFDRSTFAKIVVAMQKARDGQCTNVLKMVDLYDKVPIEMTQRVMRFWRVRKHAATDEGADTDAA